MTSTPAPYTASEENYPIVPSEEEGPGDDSSSDSILSSTESDDELDDGPQSPRGRTNELPKSRARSRTPSWPSFEECRRLNAERGIWKDKEKRHYRKIVRQAKWKDLSRIRRDEREAFENASFGKQYPFLSQLKIPAARGRAIMAAQETRKKEKEMLERSIASCKKADDQESNRSAQSTTCSSAQPYLTLLPVEIQETIVKYCLTTKTPFIDFCFGRRFAASEISTDAPHGQDCVSLPLLATNRHFRAVGLRIMWQNNNFLYTRSDEFTLLNTSTLMSLPQITSRRHLTLHQDSIWPYQIFYDRVMLEAVLFAVSVTELFPVLEILNIDLKIGTVYPYCYERIKWLRATLLEVHYFLRDISNGRSLRALQQLSITGVTDDDLGCLAVKLASYLVATQGRLGITLADIEEWKRWSESPLSIVFGDTDMVWIKAQDVNTWLDQRREVHRDQRRLFEWEDFFPKETAQLEYQS